MDRAWLKEQLAAGRSIKAIADAAGKGQSTVAYWINKHGLAAANAARHQPKGPLGEAILGELVERGASTREIAAELAEAGGRCVVCGYARYSGALQSHHVDPSTKRFEIASRGLTRSLDVMREEAERCALLCGNCHAEVEAGVTELPFPLRPRGG
jgi:hypothetical protein